MIAEDKRFDKIETKLEEVLEVVQYMAKNMATKSELGELENKFEIKFNKLEAKVDDLYEMKTKVDDIYNMFDTENAAISKNEMETASAHHKLERHDGWIKTIAKETNVALPA